MVGQNFSGVRGQAQFLAEAKQSFRGDIFDIPRLMHKIVGSYTAEYCGLLEQCRQLGRSKKRVILAAEGTSLCACHVGMHMLADRGRWAHAVEAGEFADTYGKLDLSDCVVVFVSFSGGTLETIQAAHAVAGRVPTVAVTNSSQSQLALLCDLALPLEAGTERLMALKSFTLTVVTLGLFSAAFCGEALSDAPAREWRECADAMQGVLDTGIDELEALFARMSGADSAFVLANGLLSGAAMDGALILKEGAGMHGEFMTAYNFRHGPLMVADERRLVILLAAGWQPFYRKLVGEIRHYGARVLVFGDADLSGDAELAGDGQVGMFRLPQVARATMPALYILPLQLYSEFLCTEEALYALKHVNEVVVSKQAAGETKVRRQAGFNREGEWS